MINSNSCFSFSLLFLLLTSFIRSVVILFLVLGKLPKFIKTFFLNLSPQDKEQLKQLAREFWTATDEKAVLAEIQRRYPALYNKIDPVLKQLKSKIEGLTPEAKAFVKKV
ncbi:unnamed protein product, partial [Enterobius vermicularis]